MPATFRYGKVRIALYALLSLGLGALGVWQARRTEGEDQLWAIGLVGMGVLAVLVMARILFDARPAVAVSREGIAAQRLGGKVTPWAQISAVWLRLTKRRAFFVVPFDSPELVLEIHPDQPYWRQGGLGRAVLRLLSRASGDHNVLVNLNGLSGGKPERVIEAIRALRPDLVRETETRLIKADE